MAPVQPEVIEVVEYIDDDDYDGDSDFEEVVEIVEEVVQPRKNFSAVKSWEVGIGKAPPAFLTPKQKAKFSEASTPSSQATKASQLRAAADAAPSDPGQTGVRQSPRSTGRRISAKRHASIVNNALGLPEDDGCSEYSEYEEIIEEEIIEEEYEEVIEEECKCSP